MKNLTVGRPIKLIVLFAIPLLIGNLFQQVYLIADTLIVGRLIGVTALAGVGATGSIIFLLVGFSQAMTAGFAIVTAQHFGARNNHNVRRSFCASLMLGAIVAIIMTTGMVFMLKPMLGWMNTPEEIFEHAYAFSHVIFLGIGATVLYNLLANTILALGDARPPLVFLMVSTLVNVGLDLLFILHLGMGVEGAALATVLAQLTASALCIAYIAWRLPVLHPNLKSFRLRLVEIWRTFRVGLPMGFQISIIAMGAIILQSALNKLGPTAVAAYTASLRIDFLAIMVFMSLGMAMSTFTAQNFGARDIGRIRQGVRETILLSTAVAVVMGTLIILGGKNIVALFVGPGEDEVLHLAGIFLRINGSTYVILALLFVYRGALQGLGKTFAPMLAGTMELFMRAVVGPALIIPYGFMGACLSNPLSWIGSCVPLAIIYFITIRRLSARHPQRPTPATETVGLDATTAPAQ